MTNAPKNDGVGDRIARSLRQPVERLEKSAARDVQIPAEATPKASTTSKTKGLAKSLNERLPLPGTTEYCKQEIWFSFFFDGTGNNLAADVESNKHSNVAKLYRAHKGDENIGGTESKTKGKNSGIYRIYVPGIGTYFRAIGDDGGSDAGLGAGAYGDARLDWAYRVFVSKMESHIALANNPANAIVEVNIAAFGFSRGAALARAFIHDFVEKRCKLGPDRIWILKSGNCPVKIRFMGLFDTVASVGLAMSANNMEKIDAIKGNILSHISTRLAVHQMTRPSILAFELHAQPGVDPAPGNYNGHAQWGDRLIIPEMVDDVRHFVAAHEIRNSFPSDSISVIEKNGAVRMPKTFHEYVYPGVHSDVGGSYRPGEGGKNEKFDTKLGLIPLREMYKFAMAAGIPLLPETAWSAENRQDFALNPKVEEDFQYYMTQLKGPVSNIGDAFNAHMSLYYSWRFHSIARKRRGDRSEENRIMKSSIPFNAEAEALRKKIALLEGKYVTASSVATAARWKRDDYVELNDSAPDRAEILAKLDKKLNEAIFMEEDEKDLLLNEKAKMLALPKTSDLPSIVEIYDNQLMLDAQAIYEVMKNPQLSTFQRGFVTGRATLRPHYKVMMEAYLSEIIDQIGLKNERVFAFFDDYVHDSLAGFGKDGTLPSDPRVIYVGGDEKLKYAGLEGIYPFESIA
jgi:hypothetical protein